MRLLLIIIASLFSLLAYSQADTLKAGLYTWTLHEAKPNKTGESQLMLESATVDLSRFRIHRSTLNPGQTNHPLVAYSDKEELLIVRSGVLTLQLDNEIKELSAGSVVMMQPGTLQSCSNKSKEPVTYLVLAFVSKDTIQLDRGKTAGGSEMHDWVNMTVKKTERGFSRPIIRKPTSMFSLFDIHATTLNAGQMSHLPHTHRNEEVIILIEGSGDMLINDKTYNASEGEILYVSPNIPHNFTNTGTSPCTYFAVQWTR